MFQWRLLDTLNTWDGTTEYIYSSVNTGTTTYFDVSRNFNKCYVGITGITQNGVYHRELEI